mgnify:CR=1 FL=1
MAAVPRLIELVDHKDAAVAEAARRALLVVTKQDFGRKERAWRAAGCLGPKRWPYGGLSTTRPGVWGMSASPRPT